MQPLLADRQPAKPRLRGTSHLFAFFAALGAGAVLLTFPPANAARAALAYCASLAAMFGVSALYHRPTWPPRIRAWLRRLDHATIFILVAGTYTPFALILEPKRAVMMLAIAWGGAGLGVLQSLLWIRAPKPLVAALYLALGWAAVMFIPPLHQALGAAPVGLLLAGGVLYSLGALAYALRWPDLVPATFGYHEVFHALVIGAAICHFAAVLLVMRGLGVG